MTIEHAFQTALTQHRTGRIAEAEAIYRQILAVHPRHADSFHLLGVIATARGRCEEAVELISQAIAIEPGAAVYHSNLGVTLGQLGRQDEAVASLQRAIALCPGFADAHVNLGEVLLELRQPDQAIACARRALELQPDCVGALNNLGNALAQMRQFSESLACHERAVALDPCSALSHNNLGIALLHDDRWEEAAASFRRATALQPGFLDAQENLAGACMGLGHLEEALALYNGLLAVEPERAGTHWNRSLLLLLLGRYEEGWREYEWRWRHAGFPGRRRDFSAPQWNGEAAPGQTILVHAEQGIGDAIQFLRYVLLVRERAEADRVILEIPEQLARVFAQGGGTGFEIAVRPDWSGATLPTFDWHVPLLGLPLALRVFEPLHMDAPYLHAAADSVAEWRTRLGSHSGLRVGLCWAGSATHSGDRRRSIAFEELDALLRVPGVDFYSLQIEPSAPHGSALIDLTAHLADFADTAALMAELDLIITVDTAVAHLAGALGRPVWTLLPRAPDWRWGSAGETTPWYPTMRLFRQRRAGDWGEAIARVAGELQRMRP